MTSCATRSESFIPQAMWHDRFLNKEGIWGTWVAQWVRRPTLGFDSSCDLRVLRSSPKSGSTLSAETA